ncbi:nucleoside 2-deoxyribosyltransferase [Candidatus Dojkabacteria bacterium]|nr:nucleoside 2-deoxyribosyltransferase [Candidatus Dojkabacteria bacterium]
MKVYFTGSITHKKENKDWYTRIIHILESNGHTLNKANLKVDPSQLKEYSENQIVKTYKNIMKWIDEADVVIAELSKHSSGVGYEIAYALDQRKPVLAIYNKKLTPSPVSIPIRGNPSRYLVFKECDDKTLETTLKEFLRSSKQKLDTKFILIISPEIDRYLEWASDFKRMHKAQIVRNAVENDMNSDKDYRAFLKEKTK